MLYIFTFLLSTILVYVGNYIEHNQTTKSRLAARFFYILAIVIVAYLAGARDLSVGTDTAGYGATVFRYALYSNDLSALIRRTITSFEPLYVVLNYLISRFTDNIHIFYFSLGLLIYGFTFAGVVHYKDKVSLTLAWACYLFLFYGDTLNAMRQMLACAIIFWASPFFFRKKYVKYCIFVVISFFCHNSALLALFVPIVFVLLKKKNTFLMKCTIILGMGFAIVFYSAILHWLIKLNILNSGRYLQYVGTGIPIDINAAIIRAPMLFFVVYYRKKFSGNDEDKLLFDTVLVVVLADILLSQMRSVVQWLYRLTLYSGMYRCLAYSRIAIKANRNDRLLIKGILLLYLIIVFIYQVIIQGNNAVYPYVFYGLII